MVEQGGQRLRVMKGAVRTVAEARGLQPPAIEALERRVGASAAKGSRTLAVARGHETGTPSLVGLVSLYDPPRPDAGRLIAARGDRLGNKGSGKLRRVADPMLRSGSCNSETVWRFLADPERRYPGSLKSMGSETGRTSRAVSFSIDDRRPRTDD